MDQTVRLCDAETLEEITVLRGHTSEVWCVEFSQDGQTLLTSGKDGTMCVWSVKPTARNDLLTRDVNFWQWPLFSDNGQLVAVAERKTGVSLWRVSDGSPAGIIAAAQRPLAFGTNAETLFALGHEGELQQWKLSGTNALLVRQVKSGAEDVLAHAFLPERGMLVTGDRDGKIRVWDVNSGAELGNWKAHPNRVESMALSPDHTLLATASESENEAKIWDLARRELKTILRGHKLILFSVAFSPDGRTVATASVDDTCRLWDPLTGKCLAVLGGHQGGTYSVAFAPDGRTLAVGSGEGVLKLWNLATRRDMMTLVAEPGAIFSTGFSPDGRVMATVSFDLHNDNCSLKLWRAPMETDHK
jgi:WD40 repeat protein